MDKRVVGCSVLAVARTGVFASEQLKRRTGVALAVLTLVGGGLLFGPEAAFAQTCINDVWKAHGNKQNVTCTAGDVNLSSATNIDITTGGECVNGVCSCFATQTVTFTADFRMDLTAEARYDVGFYLATDGDHRARRGLERAVHGDRVSCRKYTEQTHSSISTRHRTCAARSQMLP